MKRTAYMEYQLNDTRSHVIRREHRARNPLEVGINANDHRIALDVYSDGQFELIVDGLVMFSGAVS